MHCYQEEATLELIRLVSDRLVAGDFSPSQLLVPAAASNVADKIVNKSPLEEISRFRLRALNPDR